MDWSPDINVIAAERRARLARLGAASNRPVVARPPALPLPAPTPEPPPARAAIAPPKRDFLFIATPRPSDDPRDIIRLIATKHGLAVESLTKGRGRPFVVAARHEAMVAVADAFPMMSIFRIAHDYFGRDHTTMLNAMRRHGRASGSAERLAIAESKYGAEAIIGARG